MDIFTGSWSGLLILVWFVFGVWVLVEKIHWVFVQSVINSDIQYLLWFRSVELRPLVFGSSKQNWILIGYDKRSSDI